jgi:hypothetical protein
MYPFDERVIRAIDADRRRSSIEAIHRADLPDPGPNPVRRAIGRSLISVGARLAGPQADGLAELGLGLRRASADSRSRLPPRRPVRAR